MQLNRAMGVAGVWVGLHLCSKYQLQKVQEKEMSIIIKKIKSSVDLISFQPWNFRIECGCISKIFLSSKSMESVNLSASRNRELTTF